MSEQTQQTQLNLLKDKYKDKMVTEFTKFLQVYNEISESNYIIDIRGEYDIFIHFLGNYIYTKYNHHIWDESSIKFSDDVVINLSVFKDTKYYEAVDKFLFSLKKAFFESLDDDVYNYLKTTEDYNDEEKVLCTEFYDRISNLNNAMKHHTFASSTKPEMSSETISIYKKELKEFNNYVYYISSKKELFSLINNFDDKIRKLFSNKNYSEILFNA
jgi:hypothetical protein